MNDRANVGCGHVYPRSDGHKARCGGPTYCERCLDDLAKLESADALATGMLKTQYTSPDHVLTRLLDGIRTQLLIVMVLRGGGSVEVPVAEVDATGQWTMSFGVDHDRGVFLFNTQKKA